MDSSDLEKRQAEQLYTQVGSMLGYLKRLRERMTKQGFPVEDKLLDATAKAEDAIRRLFGVTHQLSWNQEHKASQGELVPVEDFDALLKL